MTSQMKYDELLHKEHGYDAKEGPLGKVIYSLVAGLKVIPGMQCSMDAETPIPTAVPTVTAAVADGVIEAITQAAGSLKREVDHETGSFIQHVREETARATKKIKLGKEENEVELDGDKEGVVNNANQVDKDVQPERRKGVAPIKAEYV